MLGANSRSAPHKATQAPTAAELAAADQLEHVIAQAEPLKAKPLLRLLIDELRVNGRAEILPYRVVTTAVCAVSEEVGAAGIEPATSRV